MKKLLLILLLFVQVDGIFSQNQSKIEQRPATQNVFIKLDGSLNSWGKSENDNLNASSSPQINGTDNVNFSSTSEGIYISILKGTNKIKLFALTGQLLLDGDLTQGHFFIPTFKGIYFLRINNKSFKVVCK